MAWINLVSERPAQRALLDRDEFADGYEDFSEVAPVLLAAGLSDEAERLRVNADRARTFIDTAIPALKAGRMKFSSWIRYADVATSAILSHYAGVNTTELLGLLLGVKPPRDRNFKALHHLIAAGFGKEPGRKGVSTPGHDKVDLAHWPEMVTHATPDALVNLALCPDHPNWSDLQHVVAPAIFAALGPDADPDTAFRVLAWAKRKDAGEGLLHVRTEPPPGPDPTAAGRDSAWAQGLDAIEQGGDAVLCHYNMSMRHWAPWQCEDRLDAFWFLTWFERDWLAATRASPALTAFDKGKRKVVICYDPANSTVSTADVARAEAKYGVTITMANFADV